MDCGHQHNWRYIIYVLWIVFFLVEANQFYSYKELQAQKEQCEAEKRKLEESLQRELEAAEVSSTISEKGNSTVSGTVSEDQLKQHYESQYQDMCAFVDNFDMSQLSMANVTSWLMTSSRDVSGIYGIVKGADLAQLKEILIFGKDNWLQSPDAARVLAALGEEIVRKLGGSRRISVKDLEDFGTTAVYMLSPVDYKHVSDDVFKYILSLISVETEKSLEFHGADGLTDGPTDMDGSLTSQGMNGSADGEKSFESPGADGSTGMEGSFESQGGDGHSGMKIDSRAVTNNIRRHKDSARIKALCSRAFQIYRKSRDINTEEGWNNVKHLMFCAPPPVCKAVNADLIQQSIAALVPQQWTCRNMAKRIHIDYGHDTQIEGQSLEEYAKHWEKETLRLFPGNKVCGKILADKLVNDGKGSYVINTMYDVARLQFLSACLPEKVLKQQVDALGCEFAKEATIRGILNQRVNDYAVKKCARAVRVENVTCEVLNTTYKPYLESMKRSFFKQLPHDVMCDAVCVEIFKEELPEDVMKHIMKNCFANAQLTSDDVGELGGLVVDLPIEKFEEISAQDLQSNINQIKTDLKGLSKRGGKKAVVKKLAKKMLEGGNIAALVDSSEIMKEVSIRDLKASLSNSNNVIQDLGISNASGSIGMTDSQKKWVVKQVIKTKEPENFQLHDLLQMKSLMTGLLSSHIKKMGLAHSNDTGGMELAAEMCSHTGWPRKSLQAIGKYLIQSSLEVRNSTRPMSSLTVVDVQNLGCQCLLGFDATKYDQMDTDVCSTLCTKIGYCDVFRCMNPIRKKNTLQACLKCKELQTKVITETDFDELGPNLISQMSKKQLDLIPAVVLHSGIELFKDMCMDQTLRTAVSSALQQVVGRSGSSYSPETLYLLGNAIKLLPVSLQQQLDQVDLMDSSLFIVNPFPSRYQHGSRPDGIYVLFDQDLHYYLLDSRTIWSTLAEMQSSLMAELVPSTEEDKRMQKCCEKWLDDSDIENLNEQNFNLMLTLKQAMFSQSDSLLRRKREVKLFYWTCRQIRRTPNLFTTVTTEEIMAMDERELHNCLPIIGGLQDLKAWQRQLLLEKAKKVFPHPDVCNFTVSDFETIGVVSQALSVDEISCLPLDNRNIVSILGNFDKWSLEQLEALAERYIHCNNLTTLSGITSTDIDMLGTIMCGFTADLVTTIPAIEIGRNGEDIGAYNQCRAAVRTAYANLAKQDDAYGPVETWGAAEVSELGYVVAGLSADDIKNLSADAIEGLTIKVIPKIPKNVFKEMSRLQLSAFSEPRAKAVTKSQKQVMTDEQRAILGDLPKAHIVSYSANQHNLGNQGRCPEVMGSLMMSLVLIVLVLL